MEPTLDLIEQKIRSRLHRATGTDSKGGSYNTLEQLWGYIYPDTANQPADKWYGKAYDYWESEENCPITDDGVLGGFGALTPMDSKGSNEFLDKLVNLLPDLKLNKAADCGAGIGRVTKSFLMNRFEYIDLIEQSPRLLNNSFNYLKLDEEEYKRRIGLINLGLQNFLPEKNSYDVIWIQWVVGHLHDLDFIKFFKRCAEGLREGGCIILKDNTIKNNSELFCLDLDDNSVCRNKKYLDILFEFCNLEIIYEEYQKDFPPELYPVAMIALRLKK